MNPVQICGAGGVAGRVAGRLMRSACRLVRRWPELAAQANGLVTRGSTGETRHDKAFGLPKRRSTRSCAPKPPQRGLGSARHALSVLLVFGLVAARSAGVGAQPLAQPMAFRFAVVGSSLGTTSKAADLRAALEETDADNLAFVVVHGIKPRSESCKDEVYLQKRHQLQQAKNGIIVSLVASDWAQCSTARGRSSAVERLNRLREFFFVGDFSLGHTRMPLMRQSASPQFRGIGENARWEVGSVLFATINLPGKNNQYVTDAGRNSEYEDRLIANRAWLKRLMTIASYRKFGAVVLFADGDPVTKAKSRLFARETGYDGYADVRRQLRESAASFAGKVLIVHGQPSTVASWKTGGIRWDGNLGMLDASTGLLRIGVEPTSPSVFSVTRGTNRQPDMPHFE